MANKTILVPTSFNEASRRALELAKEFAGPLGLDVVLLHVHEPPVLGYPELPTGLTAQAYAELAEAARRALAALSAAEGGLRAVLRTGDPALEILAAIEELEPEMVVMGTHGRRGLRRFALGSVTEHVVRESKRPVATVRAPETPKA